MNRRAVCAIDVGTSAVRASLVATDATVLRSTRRERSAGEGSVEFDASALWDDLVSVLRELDLADAPPACLAIAGHVGAVAIGDDGEPVRKGIGWASTAGVEILSSHWKNSAAFLRLAGRPAVTGGAVPFLAWLREHEPSAHARVRWVLSPKDDLIRRLCGVVATDATSAAYTLASDIRARAWSPTLAAASGVEIGCFPPQRLSTEIVGAVTDAAAALTRLPAGLPIAAGGPDGTVGAAAVAGARAGVIVDVAGTTDVLTRIVLDPDDPVTSGTVTNPYLVDGLWSCGGPTGLTGGATTHWLRLLNAGGASTLEPALRQAIEALPPGAEGVAISPLLTGSRFPDWLARERGAVWGLSEKHTAAHIIRATHEAAAYVVRSGIQRLVPDAPDAAVIMAGGTARSDNLAQLRADVLRRTVSACADPDVSLRGAAMIACVGAGFYGTLDDAAKTMAPALRHFTPDPSRADAYDRLYDEWQETRAALAGKE